MDFFTSHDGPVCIRIDGKEYALPRFLTDALIEWGERTRRQAIDDATAEMKAEARARFLLFLQPPAIDVARQLDEAYTAAGARYVVGRQLDKAGVPADVRDKVLSCADPILLRNLSVELTTARRARPLAGEDSDKADPTSGPASAPTTPSGASASTGPAGSPSSATPTPAPTQAA